MMLDNVPEEVSKKITELVELIKHGRVAIFFGSGISCKQPSNLPSARELRKEILNTLMGDHMILQGSKKAIMGMQFEAFIEIIERNVRVVEILAKLFRSGKPNKNHKLIANLIAQGKIRETMTTNFDTKLEEALKNLDENGSLLKSRAPKIYYSEKHFNGSQYKYSDSPSLFKVHGTIDDLSSMRATLDHVSSRVLVEARTEVLKHFFEEVEHTILILGYSGSDNFDINRVLVGIEKKKKIIWVKRPYNEPPGVCNLPKPFNLFEGHVLRVDFDALIDFLWNEFVKNGCDNGNISDEWREIIQEWGGSLRECEKLFTLAQILYELSAFLDSKLICEESRTLYEELGDQNGVAATSGQLAMIHQARGEFDEAKKLYEQVKTTFEKLRDQRRVATTLHQMATIHKDQGEYDEAKDLYEKSLKIKEGLGDQKGVAATLHQLAMIYQAQGKYDEARELYEQVKTTFERLGDQNGVAATLHQLAMINQARGEFDEAKELYKQVKTIVERLGDQRRVATTLHQLAAIDQAQGKYDEARELYEQVKTTFERLGDQSGVAATLGQQAMIYLVQREYDKARELYEQVNITFEKLRDQRRVATTLHRLGMIHHIQGEYDEAKDLYEKSLKIKEKLRDEGEIAATLHQLAMIYQAQGEMDTARELFEKSQKIFKKLGKSYTRALLHGA